MEAAIKTWVKRDCDTSLSDLHNMLPEILLGSFPEVPA